MFEIILHDRMNIIEKNTIVSTVVICTIPTSLKSQTKLLVYAKRDRDKDNVKVKRKRKSCLEGKKHLIL